jgi:hypothetical protein
MKRMMLMVALGVIVALPCESQQIPGMPSIPIQPKGQSVDQMQNDIMACVNSAKQATGYDPSQATAAAKPEVGGRAKGAATGAMAGAAAGRARSNQYDNVPSGAQEQYRENQARSGAAAGAAAGASRQRQDRREARRDERTQQSKADSYNDMYKSCMQAKNYIVG